MGQVRTKTEAKGIISEYLKKQSSPHSLFISMSTERMELRAQCRRGIGCLRREIYLIFLNFSGLKVIPLRVTAKFAALTTILSEFDRLDPHYSYTLPQANETYESVNEEVGE